MPRGGKRVGAGRPKGARDTTTQELKQTLTETARGYTKDAIDALVDIMQNPKNPAAARVSAANSVLDRGHGKAATADVEKGQTVVINLSSDDAKL